MIHTRGLARDFRAKKEVVKAVKGIDIDVSPGELVAFLGPNGAGKSTTLRMLTTSLRPTRGTATVAGHDVLAAPVEVRRAIGYIGQGNGVSHNHRIVDELVDHGRFYGMTGRDARRRAAELLELLGLAGMAKRSIGTLSGGQRRRADIALGLMHRPALLFLDEPSTGLDPQNRANLAEEIVRLRAELGMTIFLTTHYLEEADQLAERVLIIDDGEVIAAGSPAELKATLAGDRITLGMADEVAAKSAAALLEGSARETTVSGATVILTVENGESALPRTLRALDAADLPADTAKLRIPTLDDVFLSLTGRTLRDADAA
ncbi:ABC-2 type transport system ATP-binding protein [Stackebrandtia albiflava]|uniref:ABC-2 type transport system ATP-binding protein n=1 Tax=Stackebrandtia albiflava TaxID=406432 RepID=A0A562VAA7_9ACTN|nr:ATP-binding cassette domain-containing protein [Stackebrandtia albiflava]TWJ14783.1 ABC-2 type transport system ATP-binding protein [Stackebrandtia albiflava]